MLSARELVSQLQLHLSPSLSYPELLSSFIPLLTDPDLFLCITPVIIVSLNSFRRFFAKLNWIEHNKKYLKYYGIKTTGRLSRSSHPPLRF